MPYKYHIEIDLPEYSDFECANCNTMQEALAWKASAELAWPGHTAIISEN